MTNPLRKVQALPAEAKERLCPASGVPGWGGGGSRRLAEEGPRILHGASGLGITGQSIPGAWNSNPFFLRSECSDDHYLILREKQLWEDIKSIKRYLRY